MEAVFSRISQAALGERRITAEQRKFRQQTAGGQGSSGAIADCEIKRLLLKKHTWF